MGNNRVKAEVLLDYARWYSPDPARSDFTFIPHDDLKMLEALRSAYALDPDNITIADWWGEELDKRKQYSAALEVYRHSSNPHTYQRIGEMYETGKGTSIDISQAISWYKRSAKEQSSADLDRVIAIYFRSPSVHHLYRLICQKKISPAAATPYFKQQEYQRFFQESLIYQSSENLKMNPCIPRPGG
jgi:TPR repeat protein